VQDSVQRHAATIEVDQRGMAIVKVTYHPNWHAYLDGKRVDTMMVMPSYIGVPIEAGRHTLELRYASANSRNALFLLGAIVMIGVMTSGAIASRNRVVARALAWAQGDQTSKESPGHSDTDVEV
jgi:uncharacterized membrane protein YfhO